MEILAPYCHCMLATKLFADLCQESWWTTEFMSMEYNSQWWRLDKQDSELIWCLHTLKNIWTHSCEFSRWVYKNPIRFSRRQWKLTWKNNRRYKQSFDSGIQIYTNISIYYILAYWNISYYLTIINSFHIPLGLDRPCCWNLILRKISDYFHWRILWMGWLGLGLWMS